jgi:hypothetical protein
MANELRKRLAIVGMTGAVFTGAVFGVGSLASANTGTGSTTDPATGSSATSEPAADPAVTEEADHDLSEFDGFSDEDQAVILRFEECLGDLEAGLPDDEDAWTDEDYDRIDATFEECEPILDDLSFDADEWLDEGDEHWDEIYWDEVFDELSTEDQAVFEQFDQCLADVEDAFDAELPEDESTLTDEQWEELEARFEEQFETCDQILDNLSDEAQDLLFLAEFDEEAWEFCDDYEDEDDDDYEDGDEASDDDGDADSDEDDAELEGANA